MLRSTHIIFGKDIPTALSGLAKSVNDAICDAERSTTYALEVAERLNVTAIKLEKESEKCLDAEHLKPRNFGGHFYPGAGPPRNIYATSNCEHCDCWIGPTRSGAPEGVDQFGDCPGNPKLRDAYNLLKEKAIKTE